MGTPRSHSLAEKGRTHMRLPLPKLRPGPMERKDGAEPARAVEQLECRPRRDIRVDPRLVGEVLAQDVGHQRVPGLVLVLRFRLAGLRVGGGGDGSPVDRAVRGRASRGDAAHEVAKAGVHTPRAAHRCAGRAGNERRCARVRVLGVPCVLRGVGRDQATKLQIQAKKIGVLAKFNL